MLQSFTFIDCSISLSCQHFFNSWILKRCDIFRRTAIFLQFCCTFLTWSLFWAWIWFWLESIVLIIIHEVKYFSILNCMFIFENFEILHWFGFFLLNKFFTGFASFKWFLLTLTFLLLLWCERLRCCFLFLFGFFLFSFLHFFISFRLFIGCYKFSFS